MKKVNKLKAYKITICNFQSLKLKEITITTGKINLQKLKNLLHLINIELIDEDHELLIDEI